MKVVAVVPVRAPGEGKSRLAGILSPRRRADLVRGMLARVLAALDRARRIDEVWVVTPDEGLVLPRGVRALHGHFARQACVAPLERGASGLQVFTQDWRVTRKIEADLRRLEQEFIVEVRGQTTPQALERLARGATRNDRELPKAKASWQNEIHLRMALKNPQPGQIAELCAYLRLELVGMRRIRLGGVSMGKLPLGQWRYVASTERF